MLERVQRDAAEHPGRGIAQLPRSPCMSALMHTEGEDKNNNLKENKYDFLIHPLSLSEVELSGA